MRLLVSFLFFMSAVTVFAWQTDPQTGSASGDKYLEILKKAKEDVRSDSTGQFVKLANLDSYGRQNDTASVRPIRESDVMFKVRLWSKMNFIEKINSNFNAKESDFIKLIYEGIQAYYNENIPPESDAFAKMVENGQIIVPYANNVEQGNLFEKSDFINRKPLTKAEYDEALLPKGDDFNKENFEDGQNRTTYLAKARLDFPELASDPTKLEEKARELFLAEQNKSFLDASYNPILRPELKMDQIVFEEDLLFDKNHSVPMWDIISIAVYTPSEAKTQGPLFKVKYEHVKKYIERTYRDTRGEKGYWFNPQNPGSKDLSFSDAIDKRLFNSFIVSVENVSGEDVATAFAQGDEYNSLLFAEKIRLQLLERFHNLWEY